MRLTLLRPTEKWARTAKGFNKPQRGALEFDYNLGKNFTFENRVFRDLAELATCLQTTENAIAIYGAPTELADALGVAPRQTIYFPYPEDQRLHIFDLDKWPVPEATRDLIKPNLLNPVSMGELVNTLLRHEGFDLIADAEKVVVLTSSSWDTTLLNCHLYVVFDAPVRVEALREYATALAKVHQRTLFDPAIYKSVQPQFFNGPTCVGFEDPYRDTRIFLVKGHTPHVSLKSFEQHVATTLRLADWNPQSSANSQPPIGRDWLQTIEEFVGTERGVNEPSHRAAAQLVQSVGKQHVMAHLNEFAQQMFDAVWRTIARKGERGDAKDKATYTVERFRQYISSACDKTFGDQVDQLVQTVQEAVQAALGGSIDKMMTAPVIHALKKLKASHAARYIPLQKAIIEKHKILKARELNALIKSAPDDGVEGELITGGEGWNENQIIDAVLNQYDYLVDIHGNRFASVPGNGDGGYRMMRIDGSLVDVFFADGLRLSGNQVGGTFGKKALSKLVGEENRAIDTSFAQQLVGSRVIAEDQTSSTPTWLNLGLQPDGQYKSARIEPDKVTLVPHQQSKPRWFWGVPPLVLPSPDALRERFNGFGSMMDYLLSAMPNFICTDDDDTIKTIMWLCSTMADKSLAYLLEVVGPPGSGKSTGADFIKDLVDPSGKVLGTGGDRTAFFGVSSDFISDIERRHITILDNISKLTSKEQDMLCMISTGLRHSERILYTQSMMERTVRRPIIITALASVITRPDLRSRVVSIEMSRAPFNPRFMEEWYKERAYLTACMLQLTARTLKLYNDVTEKPQDLHPRDIFLACVHSAINGLHATEYNFVREFRLREAFDAAYDSNFVGAFSRFLDATAAGNDTICIDTRHLHSQMRRWCQLNAGREIDGVTIDILAVPETGRGLGWELSKHIGTIEKVTSWKLIEKENSSNGKRYTFKKIVDNISDLL